MQPLTIQILPVAGADQRKGRRFEIRREARYRTVAGHYSQRGETETINISSKGVAFRTCNVLTPGIKVELSLSWPVLLNDVRPIRLVVEGRVTRSDTAETAMTIDRYEFRTHAPAPLENYDAPGRPVLLQAAV